MSNNPPDDPKPLSKREEERLLKAGRSVFSTAFPNPNREGCPPQELIAALARNKARLGQHQDFILHMSRCSPCYNDFARFRKAAQRQRRLTAAGIAAIIIIICLASWLVVRARHSSTSPYAAVYDLNNRLMLRGFGESGKQTKGPMVLRRGVANLTLYLPSGSRTGPYQVGVLTEASTVSVAATGTASLEGSRTVLRARLDVSRLNSGHYLLGIRPPGVDWSYYPLVVR